MSYLHVVVVVAVKRYRDIGNLEKEQFLWGLYFKQVTMTFIS